MQCISFFCPYTLCSIRQNYYKSKGGNYVTEITYYAFTASIQPPQEGGRRNKQGLMIVLLFSFYFRRKVSAMAYAPYYLIKL